MNNRHRAIKRIQKRYKHLAAAVAAAAILSGGLVPGTTPPIAHAAITPPVGDTSMAAQAKTGLANTAPTDFKQAIEVKATAYAPGWHDNGQWGNKTHLGTTVRPGVIAVDPRIIPLGSRVYIQYPDGHGEYAIAEDTGGAIKGHRIDIAKSTVGEAYDFGIQNVKVLVISTPNKVKA